MYRMNDFFDAIEEAGFRLSDFVAGLAGGLVSLLIDDSEKSLWHRAFNVIAGAITAGYCTPLVAHWLALSPGFEGAVAFIIGSIGLKIMDKILHFVEINDVPTIIRL